MMQLGAVIDRRLPAPTRVTLDERVGLLRRDGDDFVLVETVAARVRPCLSKRGNSHTVVCAFRTDVRPGWQITAAGETLEVIRAHDMNGKRVFLQIAADRGRAKLTRLALSRKASVGE